MKRLFYLIFPFVFVHTCYADTGNLKELTPIPQVTVLPTAMPTAFGTPFLAANAEGARSLTINNGFNQDVWCDYGVGTPAPFTVPAGSSFFSNFANKGMRASGAVRCIHPSSTPASGTLQIFGEK